eukprot:scaffold625_cov324-Pavlova_lutheri.AAC.149
MQVPTAHVLGHEFGHNARYGRQEHQSAAAAVPPRKRSGFHVTDSRPSKVARSAPILHDVSFHDLLRGSSIVSREGFWHGRRGHAIEARIEGPHVSPPCSPSRASAGPFGRVAARPPPSRISFFRPWS